MMIDTSYPWLRMARAVDADDRLQLFKLLAELSPPFTPPFLLPSPRSTPSQILPPSSHSISPPSLPLSPLSPPSQPSQPSSARSHFTRAIAMLTKIKESLAAELAEGCGFEVLGRVGERIEEVEEQVEAIEERLEEIGGMGEEEEGGEDEMRD